RMVCGPELAGDGCSGGLVGGSGGLAGEGCAEGPGCGCVLSATEVRSIPLLKKNKYPPTAPPANNNTAAMAPIIMITPDELFCSCLRLPSRRLPRLGSPLRAELLGPRSSSSTSSAASATASTSSATAALERLRSSASYSRRLVGLSSTLLA